MDQPSEPKQPASAPPQMSTLEGVGSMMVMGGILAFLGTLVHPAMWQTFLPIGTFACLAGALIARWARRASLRP